MSIFSLLNEIDDNKIVLPAIQREFVWSEDQIQRLLDSIIRDYPIGLVLLWDTFEAIQYRSFVKHYRSGNQYTHTQNSVKKRIKLVLDGQQRLQSLYIALYGSINGKFLYFDVLSGNDSDDVSEEKYRFQFATESEVSQRNQSNRQELLKTSESKSVDFVPEHYIKVADLFALNTKDQIQRRKEISQELCLSQELTERLDLNLRKLSDAFKDENALKVSTIDQDLPQDSHSRKSEADVLEIFVRVNREGTPLSRSDLIFSMLKLNWKESAEALPDFVRSINEGNSFELDTDFVIRCLFAVSDLGTKFNFELLRKKSNVEKLREHFDKCCKAIRASIDFVQINCECQSSRVIGGSLTLIPFVYYLFNTNNHDLRNDQMNNVKKAFYLLAFSRPFSRYADSRLGAFIREELKPLAVKVDETFPLENTIWWIGYWERLKVFNEDFLQANQTLSLHLVQGLTGAKVQYIRNSPEVDHIFPRSVLRKKGYDESLINHYANFWILAKGKNQNKSNHHPRDYFSDVDDRVLQNALIDREQLDYRRYTTFIESRSEAILSKVKKKLNLTERDFRINQMQSEDV
ncbi:MAG TPA: DUF262 domain-containing protein [Acidobacteriota bacterium]|jgi:uncharacterized protein with ParB-like and HNH nuclease domain/5-methylcytosine-specific restriction endonuclease McrA|nr:DUF262 domain-containing protein [Acidobacteriota bacterium]HNU01212.1 DUF262 domain-containing protein [Acidobacteriota bacterium]HQP73840.1 DUF262 domain-containing protein [Acidobacteriota bacterium]